MSEPYDGFKMGTCWVDSGVIVIYDILILFVVNNDYQGLVVVANA